VSSTPDPLCAAEYSLTTCAGQLRISCEAGYRIYEEDCGGPGQCRLTSTPGQPDWPAMVDCVSNAPDPRCSGDKVLATNDPYRFGCDGNTLFLCLGDLMASETPCGTLSCGMDPAQPGTAPVPTPGCHVQ
jgi:hypothetical protein